MPGLVLATAIATGSRVPAALPAADVAGVRRSARGAALGRRPAATSLVLALAAVSCVASLAVVATKPELTGHEASPVISWLDAHKRPGDTAVVAFGHPDYLVATGLSSPYSELWSLPVRVRDPDLTSFGQVLASPDRPTWIVTDSHGDLSGWGIDTSTAEPLFDRHYRRAVDLGDREIFVRRSRVAGSGGSPG